MKNQTKTRNPDDTPIRDLITEIKHDAIAELIAILIDQLRQQGFTFEDLLSGMAEYAYQQGLEVIEGLFEQAAQETRRHQ